MLKRFKLVDLLGQGSMGRVFRAEDVTLRRYVALKVLPTKDKHGKRDQKIEQFVREARSGASLEHPNAVTVYEIGESSGVHYIAMELVEGGNLEKLVRASGPMEVERACQIAAEAAEALSAAHALGIIHRDVKPSNLLLSRNGRCKLADFGLARIDDPEDLTPQGECAGTPCYLAPELPLGQKASPQSDIYSLGCTLWFLLTGRPPFEAKSKADMMKMHIHAALPDLRELRPDVPERLVEAIQRACAKNPGERFETADQVAKVLRTFTIPTRSGSGSMSSNGRLPVYIDLPQNQASATASGMHASGSAWAPEGSAPAASSSNLGPHLSHGSASFGPIPPASTPDASGTIAPTPLRSRVPAPMIWAGAGTVVAAGLIALGVWLARGEGRSEPTTPPIQSITPMTVTSNVLVNGTLEDASGSDSVGGWFLHDKFKPSVEFPVEGGNRFIRMTNDDAKKTVFVDQEIPVDPSWKSITVSARMRATNFKPGEAASQDARVAYKFLNADGQRVGSWPPVPQLRGNSDWSLRTASADVPQGAAKLYIQLAIFNATGTVDFDDVSVVPQK